MKDYFFRLGYSFTPFLLSKYGKILTLKNGFKFLAFFWFLGVLIMIVLLSILFINFFQSEKIMPYVDKIPEFRYVFQDGLLVDTGFPTDLHFIAFPDAPLVTVSPTLTLAGSEIKADGIYILRDGFVILNNQDTNQGIQKMLYKEDLMIDSVTFDNAYLNNLVTTYFPDVQKILFFIIPLLILVVGCILFLWYLLASLFWAVVIFIVSRFFYSDLEFDHAYSFALHSVFMAIVLSAFVSIFVGFIPFIPTMLVTLAFVCNWYVLRQKSQ